MTSHHKFVVSVMQRVAVLAVGLWLWPGFVSLLPAAVESGRIYIREYRVEGARQLKSVEVEEAVYAYLGPGRTADDVELARVALENAYHDKGYQTVSVVVPQQDPRRGIIRLEVIEGKVGRLRVHGAHYYLPSGIMREVPSLAEGTVPNMNQVSKEVVGLNRADRRVTPVLRQGVEPGTVDIDLNVEEKMPLHGALDVDNRYNANTSLLRVNGSLNYANFFQRGHVGGLGFQVAPENVHDALVFTCFYHARVSDGMSLMVQGTKQNSDISTLGGAAVSGRGEIVGLRAVCDLPTTAKFQQNFNFGVDYKHFEENIRIGGQTVASPITYYPLSANYGATWLAKQNFTEFNTSLNFHLRGMGSGDKDFSNKRYAADGSYAYLRGDLAHTRDLSGGMQAFGKVQGQLASQPLVNGEQFAGGGLGTARGYLEATALGDNGVFGTLELRSPSLIGTPDKAGLRPDEWRFHLFADAGSVTLREPLPTQRRRFDFASVGTGARIKLNNHYNGSIDVAVPLKDQAETKAGDVRITFRGWAEF